jgi:hypothetical protein
LQEKKRLIAKATKPPHERWRRREARQNFEQGLKLSDVAKAISGRTIVAVNHELVRLQEAARELDQLCEASRWLAQFERTCQGKFRKPRRVYTREGIATHHLVMLGVNVAHQCDCKEVGSKFDWFHVNHRLYNRLAWDILTTYHLLEPVRHILISDVNGQGETHGDDEYGSIVLKSYGRGLIEHFLRSNPDPEWVYAAPI